MGKLAEKTKKKNIKVLCSLAKSNPKKFLLAIAKRAHTRARDHVKASSAPGQHMIEQFMEEYQKPIQVLPKPLQSRVRRQVTDIYEKYFGFLINYTMDQQILMSLLVSALDALIDDSADNKIDGVEEEMDIEEFKSFHKAVDRIVQGYLPTFDHMAWHVLNDFFHEFKDQVKRLSPLHRREFEERVASLLTTTKLTKINSTGKSSLVITDEHTLARAVARDFDRFLTTDRRGNMIRSRRARKLAAFDTQLLEPIKKYIPSIELLEKPKDFLEKVLWPIFSFMGCKEVSQLASRCLYNDSSYTIFYNKMIT